MSGEASRDEGSRVVAAGRRRGGVGGLSPLAAAADTIERALLAAANPFFFALRRRLRWRRSGYRENEEGGALEFPTPLPGSRRERLLSDYPFEPFAGRLSRRTLEATLLFTDVLDRLAAASPSFASFLEAGGPTAVLDVGCKNFESAPGLHAFFARHRGPVRLTGVEIDAYRVYRDLHSRADYADYFLSVLPGGPHRFVAGDVTEIEGRFDAVTWFRPFLTAGPLLRWGLPLSLLRPRETLRAAIARVSPGGVLVTVHPTAEEARLQEDLLAGHPGRVEPVLLERSPFGGGEDVRAFVFRPV